MPRLLQDWVDDLPLRQQGVMTLALRGPDGTRKESAAKPIIRSLRACVMNSGRLGVPMQLGERFEGDAFMRMDLVCSTQEWDAAMEAFFASIDEYNLHFFQHLVHAAAVLGFNYPVPAVRNNWLRFYHKAVDKLHMKPETHDEFAYRLRDGIRHKEDAE